MNNWYEDPSLSHLGVIEFGANSTSFFEVYRDPSGNLLFCDHDDPDVQLTLSDIKHEAINQAEIIPGDLDRTIFYLQQIRDAEIKLGVTLI